MTASVIIYQFDDADRYLADSIYSALEQRHLAAKVWLQKIFGQFSASHAEIIDVAIVVVTGETLSTYGVRKLLEVVTQVPAASVIVASNAGYVGLDVAKLMQVDLSDWDGTSSDERIGAIASIVERAAGSRAPPYSYWSDDRLGEADDLMSRLITRAKDLRLSARALKFLSDENIIFVGDIVQRTEAEWLRTPGFGRKSLNEFKEVLSSLGLWLGMATPNWPPSNIEHAITRRDAAQRVLEMGQAKLGVTFEPSHDFLRINAAGDQSDHDAALRPLVAQLHQEVLRKARQFSSLASRLDNQVGWQGMSSLCGRLIYLLDRPTHEVPDVIGSLYSSALEIGSFFELDVAIQQGRESYAAPLEPEVRRPLEDLIRGLAPWLRSFPTIRELDDEAGQFLAQRELHAPELVINAAGRASLITDEDADALAGLLAAAKRGDFQGLKAGNRGRVSAVNMVVAVIGIVGGLVLDNYGSKSILIGRAGSFLSQAEAEIVELVDDLPGDIRAAIQIILNEHRGQSPGSSAHRQRPPEQPGQRPRGRD